MGKFERVLKGVLVKRIRGSKLRLFLWLFIETRVVSTSRNRE